MNYCKIGENIRKFRKAKGFSQEQLAEMAYISVTHLSHIETGNTKLSLPVLVELARILEVQIDDILSEDRPDKSAAIAELSEILDSCSARQVRIITDIIKATKISFDKYDID